MNKAKLRGQMAEKGYNITTLAEALNMPYPTLYRKFSGATEFTVGEAESICDVLQIPLEKRAIFFLSSES